MADEQLRLSSRTGRRTLLATVLGSGVVSLDATVVNVALPAIGEDLDAGLAGLTWVVNGYALALAALILLGGSLGDRFGRRRLFLVGLIGFGAASLLCGLAPTLPVLVAARALQGIGGALLTPGSLALIAASFHPQDRARAIGAWSGLGGIAAAIGPLVGGLLLRVDWRLLFLVNLPLVAAVVLITVRHVPETRDRQAAGRLDYPGSAAAALGLAGVTYALIEAPARGWWGVSPAIVVGLVGLAAFVVVERRREHPLVPMEIFASRQFGAANLVTLALYAALGVVFFLLTLALQVTLGLGPLAAGAALLPVTALMLVLSAPAGALATRIGPRRPMTVGPALVAVSLLMLLRLDPEAGYWVDVLPAIVVLGFGLSLTVAPLTATVLAAAEDRYAGVASGVNNAVARIGGLVAVAFLPLLTGLAGEAYRDPGLMAQGFRTAMLWSAGLVAVSAVIAWVGISDDVLKSDVSTADAQTGDGPAGEDPA